MWCLGNVSNPQMKLQSKFGNGKTNQTLNIAFYLLEKLDGKTDKKTKMNRPTTRCPRHLSGRGYEKLHLVPQRQWMHSSNDRIIIIILIIVLSRMQNITSLIMLVIWHRVLFRYHLLLLWHTFIWIFMYFLKTDYGCLYKKLIYFKYRYHFLIPGNNFFTIKPYKLFDIKH